jgi:uncharacterized protein
MLTLQYVPYNQIENLGSARRVKKLIDIVKDNKIVLMEGRLKKEEEADLIAIAMEEINNQFKGIELASFDQDNKDRSTLDKFKQNLYGMLLGDRRGMTIIGPATIVKEIKKDPNKIQLFTKEGKKKKRR